MWDDEDDDDDNDESMSEEEFIELLEQALDSDDIEDDFGRIRVRTFEDVGVLTRDKGLVIRLKGGEEFHVTVVRSR